MIPPGRPEGARPGPQTETGRAKRLAVVGAGWAGLAAAVEAKLLGAHVTLFDMAAAPGGRARRAGTDERGVAFDNGQHILIGAYAETLRIMRAVGVDEVAALRRMPLVLRSPDGRGLELPPGTPTAAFARGLLSASHWSPGERLRLLSAALGWLARGFRCPPAWTVARLSARLGPRVRAELIDPLCVAALNTPSQRASASVFLRVLRDALFSAPGASDLLLPRVDLSRVFPDAATAWLGARGAMLHWRRRVASLQPDGGGWRVDGQPFDAAILAATASQSAHLARPHAPRWAALAAAMHYEPIITVWLRSAGTRLPAPMLALASDDTQSPAQFVFDLGLLHDGEPAAQGLLAFVISGAAPWVAAGQDATANATLAQAVEQLGTLLRSPPALVRQIAERRATFACTPGLQRAPMAVAPALWAAGDHVDGPYPATLEGAVRAGVAAARAAAAG